MAGDEPTRDRPRRRAGNGSGNGVPSAARIARMAMEEVSELTGRETDSVVSIDPRDDGWRIGIEVVEVHRIPDSADVMAVYEADLDKHGRLRGYRRTKRYSRGSAKDES